MHNCYNAYEVIGLAEFCLDCWNAIHGTNDPAEKYIISEELDLCEGCGQMKQVIIMPRAESRHKGRGIALLILSIGILLYVLFKGT